MALQLSRQLGPGMLVTAAFIGPGTITTASRAGADYGFALLWALLFSLMATIVLQEMAARLGLVTRAGLAEGLLKHFGQGWRGRVFILLIIAAVGVGNAAYEAGNITGAAMAVSSVTGTDRGVWSLAIGLLAGGLLWGGQYRHLERVLIVLVLIMSVVFMWAAWLVAPDLAQMATGLLKPTLPDGSTLVVIALIGTTVVPYNLFLQANAVREKWAETDNLDAVLLKARTDTVISIGLGGLITLAILSTAAAAFFQSGVSLDGASMANQLEPALGTSAKYVFALGLFASGLTSAVTAPLAAAYAVCGALGWSQGMSQPRFRGVWMLVLVTGTVFATLGTKPMSAILFAQAANGLLLPLVAVSLLLLMNNRRLLGRQVNSAVANMAGGLVVVVATGLGLVKLLQVPGWL